MPVTKIRSRWDSGNLIFHESTSLATIADILKLEIGTVTIGSATNDVDFKIFMGASDQYAEFNCGTATLTITKVDVALAGDLTITLEDISVTQGKFVYLEGQAGASYVVSDAAGDLMLNTTTNINFAFGGTDEVRLTASALYPVTDDGNALGITDSNEWSDLFLASGGIIGWNNSNCAITHAAGVLTVTGDIVASNAAGPAIEDEAATDTNPTLCPNKADLTLGFGWAAGIIHLIVAGASEYAFSATGIDMNANTITDVGDIECTDAAGPTLQNEAATTTNPTLIPNRADETTGIGWNTAEIHFVVSGVDEVNLSASALSPGVTDSTALGTASLLWSDLYLASAAVIYFATDVSITHSTGLLTIGSGGLSIGADGAGFDVILYGDRTGSDFFWDQNGSTNGALILGTTTVSEGVDFFAYGDTAATYLHWDCSADDLLLVGTDTQLGVAGTLDSSSAATGSIHTAGGLGVGAKAYIGTDLVLVAGPLDMSTAAEDVKIIANTTAALQFTDGTTNVIDIDTRTGILGVKAVNLTLPPLSMAAASGVTRSLLYLTPATTTLTGSTGVTAIEGIGLYVAQPTITDEDAVTITDASSVYIANAPTGAGSGPATLTNAYALKVAAGASRLAGVLSVGGVATFDVQDIHTLGLTVADAKAVVQGMNTFAKLTPTILTSASSYTMTAAQMLSGLVSDTSSSGAITATLPTVADVVALIGGYVVGTSFYLDYSNPGNQTVTVVTDASTQWTMVGTMSIATTTHRRFLCVIDSATAGTVYSIGDAAA